MMCFKLLLRHASTNSGMRSRHRGGVWEVCAIPIGALASIAVPQNALRPMGLICDSTNETSFKIYILPILLDPLGPQQLIPSNKNHQTKAAEIFIGSPSPLILLNKAQVKVLGGAPINIDG